MDVDLDALLRLAHEPSSDKRRELLHAVTDMLLDSPHPHSEDTKNLFGEVMSKVVDDVDLGTRSRLAERIAPEAKAPHQLAVRLAGDDEIVVAGPVLRSSPILADDDLVDIAEQHSQDHLAAISEREQIATAVTDVLIRRGNPVVLRGVSGNHGARFSENGAQRLVDHAEKDTVIQCNLFGRDDLPAECSVRVSDMMQKSEKRPISAADETTEFVEQVIRDFADMSGLPLAHIRGMLNGDKIEPVIIVGRALDLKEAQFERLLRFRLRKPGRVGSELINAMARFKTLPVQTAQRVTRFLKVRSKTDSAA